MNYEGRNRVICKSNDDFSFIKWDDLVSSVKISPRTIAIFYANKKYKGRSEKLRKDHKDFKKLKLDNQVSSVKIYIVKQKPRVRNGEVIIYPLTNYRGPILRLRRNQPNLVKLEWDDRISSIRVGPNTSAILYEDTKYRGKKIHLLGISFIF